jgi:hypothetical protein
VPRDPEAAAAATLTTGSLVTQPSCERDLSPGQVAILNVLNRSGKS